MPSFCVVLNCCDKYGHSESISFHKFPFKRKDLLQKWTEFAQRGPAWKPTKWSAICSQHFTTDDFNCVNARKTLKKTAVPTVRIEQRLTEERSDVRYNVLSKKPPGKVEGKFHKRDDDIAADHLDYEYEDGEEILPLKTSTTSNGFKACCRLCGICASAAGTFSTNFEIFGMVQKCFPTLNIQQDDNLPKDMCHNCLQRLQNFSEFIDKVLETQCDLQKTYRIEKQAKSLEQRPLKIKQEPVGVKVKQEVSEGFDSFLSDDLDVGIDDCCEPEPDADSVDQKFGFCDFPLINAQDIINNCDIMEIVNLDDPFINIPDDDGATINAGEQVGNTSATPNIRQLLQTHMLIDEHNYACSADDLKEEWQIKKCCKTEETEGGGGGGFQLFQGRTAENGLDNEKPNVNTAAKNGTVNAEAPKAFKESERSSKPIVTSVSAIAESRLNFHNEPTMATEDNATSSSNNRLVVTSISDLLPGTVLSKPESIVTSKPNIVVLNESIVKSAEAFQLHACSMCQLKFFSIESLQQHVQFSHMAAFDAPVSNNVPMVSLPVENITTTLEADVLANKENSNVPQNDAQNTAVQRNIVECQEMLNFEDKEQETNTNALSAQLRNLHSWRFNMKTLQLNALINTWTHATTTTTTNASQANETLQENCVAGTRSTVTTSEEVSAFGEPTLTESRLVATMSKEKLVHSNTKVAKTAVDEDQKQSSLQHVTSERRYRNFKKKLNLNNSKSADTRVAQQPPQTSTAVPQRIAADYKFLQRRFRLLMRKCKALEENCQALAGSTTNSSAHLHICPHCRTRHQTIYQLLHHKQKHHRAQRIRNSFSASCFGCEKYFLSKRALMNHMKYICQSMSLRWFKTQLQTFKCRACRSISFTHWRLFRNHEISCKRKLELKRQKKKLQRCTVCATDFGHRSALAQHMSMEDGAMWRLQCEKCNGNFQQIHAVMQHHTNGACKLSNPATSTFSCAVRCTNCQQSFRRISKLLQHNHCRNTNSTRDTHSATIVRQRQALHPRAAKFVCSICHKLFGSTNSLSQHRITHSQEKRHKCGLCTRVFKRRGGLTQHMKGFHLQLKPYECPVCKHRYALKCDMQRCRHSALQKRTMELDNPTVHPSESCSVLSK